MNNNKIITISGLSACGKTTLLRKLRDRYGAFLVPSSSSLRDKNKNFQDISDSLEDNIVKQKYYFELDKRVSSIAQNAKNEGKLVFCDRDFLSALAHNYAVHQQFPETSVYLCCHDWRRRFSVGNINTSSLHDIWESENYTRLRMMVNGKLDSDKNFLCRSCKLCPVEAQ